MRVKPLHVNVDLVNRLGMTAAANRTVEQERLNSDRTDADKRKQQKEEKAGAGLSQASKGTEPRKEPTVWRRRPGGKSLWIIYLKLVDQKLVVYANDYKTRSRWIEICSYDDLHGVGARRTYAHSLSGQILRSPMINARAEDFYGEINGSPERYSANGWRVEGDPNSDSSMMYWIQRPYRDQSGTVDVSSRLSRLYSREVLTGYRETPPAYGPIMPSAKRKLLFEWPDDETGLLPCNASLGLTYSYTLGWRDYSFFADVAWDGSFSNVEPRSNIHVLYTWDTESYSMGQAVIEPTGQPYSGQWGPWNESGYPERDNIINANNSDNPESWLYSVTQTQSATSSWYSTDDISIWSEPFLDRIIYRAPDLYVTFSAEEKKVGVAPYHVHNYSQDSWGKRARYFSVSGTSASEGSEPAKGQTLGQVLYPTVDVEGFERGWQPESSLVRSGQHLTSMQSSAFASAPKIAIDMELANSRVSAGDLSQDVLDVVFRDTGADPNASGTQVIDMASVGRDDWDWANRDFAVAGFAVF